MTNEPGIWSRGDRNAYLGLGTVLVDLLVLTGAVLRRSVSPAW